MTNKELIEYWEMVLLEAYKAHSIDGSCSAQIEIAKQTITALKQVEAVRAYCKNSLSIGVVNLGDELIDTTCRQVLEILEEAK